MHLSRNLKVFILVCKEGCAYWLVLDVKEKCVYAYSELKEKTIKPLKYERHYHICNKNTVCPRSNDPFCIVTYYIKWVTTSWTYSTSSSIVKSPHFPNIVLSVPKFTANLYCIFLCINLLYT